MKSNGIGEHTHTCLDPDEEIKNMSQSNLDGNHQQNAAISPSRISPKRPTMKNPKMTPLNLLPVQSETINHKKVHTAPPSAKRSNQESLCSSPSSSNNNGVNDY
jgi:pyocin large subunit-like protein